MGRPIHDRGYHPEHPPERYRCRLPLRASSSSSSSSPPANATQTHTPYDQPFSRHGGMTGSRSGIRGFNANYNGVEGFNEVGGFTDPSSQGMMDMSMGGHSNSSGSVNSDNRVSTTTRRHHPTRHHHHWHFHHHVSTSSRNENYHSQASNHFSIQSNRALHQDMLNPPRSMGVSEMSRPIYRRRSSNSIDGGRSWQSYQGGSHPSNRPDRRSRLLQSNQRQSTQHHNEGQWIPWSLLDEVVIADQMSAPQVNLIPPPSETYPDNILPHLDGEAVVQDLITRQTHIGNNLERVEGRMIDVMREEHEILQALPLIVNFSLHGPNVRFPIDDDINMMSYEELLELTEQIGNENPGLTEQTILEHLKTRVVCPSTAEKTQEICIVCQSEYKNQEKVGTLDCGHDAEKTQEICIVCQSEYKNQEKIGTLDCGHEYHVDCIKDWLLVKNDCPICRRPTLKV